MSRTFKDKPYWVTATWWEPQHYPGCPNYIGYWPVRGRQKRVCDLPPEPVVICPTQRRRYKVCQWVPWIPRRSPGFYLNTPPRRFIDHMDTSPTRAKVRDDCRKAVMEYNGSGDVDVIPPTNQHRHCATWLWV